MLSEPVDDDCSGCAGRNPALDGPETHSGTGRKKEVEIFKGADDQAKDVIGTLAPGYKPWFKPLMEPPSGEIGSLLFALQAVLGAGFIGYYLGAANTRSKYDKAISKAAKC